MTPDQLQSFRDDARGCDAAGVHLTPSAWRDGEAFETAMAMLRLIPDKHLWQDAYWNWIRATAAIWPPLAGLAFDGRSIRRRRHDYARDFGVCLWRPHHEDEAETLQFLADNLGPDEVAVYFVEPTGAAPGDTLGFWMAKPRGGRQPSDRVLRELSPAGRCQLFHDLGFRRV
jgi:hypothetical protein